MKNLVITSSELPAYVAMQVFRALNPGKVTIEEKWWAPDETTIVADTSPLSLVYPEGWHFYRGKLCKTEYSGNYKKSPAIAMEVPRSQFIDLTRCGYTTQVREMKMCHFPVLLAAQIFCAVNNGKVSLERRPWAPKEVSLVSRTTPGNLIYPEGWIYVSEHFCSKLAGLDESVPMRLQELLG